MRTVISCVNNAYLNPLKVWLSVIAQQVSGFQVIVYHTADVNPSTLPAYPWLSWRLLDVPAMKGTRPDHMQGTVMRFLAFDDLFRRGTIKITYMDLDALPVGNIAPLLNAAVSPTKPIAAVPDMVHNLHPRLGGLYDRNTPEIRHRLQFNPLYFNAGVMTIHLPGLYQRTGKKSLYDYWSENRQKYLFHGHDPLNELVEDYLALSSRYNAFADAYIAPRLDQTDLELLSQSIRSAAVIHWLFNTKPWEAPRGTSAAWAVMPHDLYRNAAERVLDALDSSFVEALDTAVHHQKE